MAQQKAQRSLQDWLTAGLQVLVASGAGGLTIDTLCRRLDVTKGSFYHHFPDQRAYRQALLEHWEQEHTLNIIRLSEEQATPAERLVRLGRLVSATDAGIGVAVRAWALRDPYVQAFQARVDQARLAYLQAVCLPLVGDPDGATVLAHLLYSVYIGAQQMIPPLSATAQGALAGEIFRRFGIPAGPRP